jgi:hypothetical protein
MGSWQHAGRMLRGLRENRGWEVPKLAAELKAKATAIGQAVPDRQSLVRMIYEWEAGTHRPRAYYVLFVLVYATEEELAARTIRRGSELYRLMAALKAMGVPVNRRQFLLNAAALAGGVAGLPTFAVNLDGQERLVWVLEHPRSVDLPTVAYLRTRTFDLMKHYEAVASPTSLLSQTAERLEQITLLREHAFLGRVQQELWRVETQSATLLGRLTWDVSGQRDHATAARYYDQAIAAASNVKEGWAEAFPRMFQRFLPVYTGGGNPQTGLYLAEQATTRAADGSSHVVAGWSAAFAAEAHALLGEERKGQAALGAGRLPSVEGHGRRSDVPGLWQGPAGRLRRCLPASLARPHEGRGSAPGIGAAPGCGQGEAPVGGPGRP